MQLELQREIPTHVCTPGSITTDGDFASHSLERHPDDPDHRCIPAGTYEVTLRPTYNDHLWTPYSDRVLPHIENVPGREGILMHAGNKAADTIGCVLVGYDRPDPDMIGRSRVALKALIDELRTGGTHQIEVKDA